MKRVKKVAALLVALVMMFAGSIPVRAHDVEGAGAGPTTLEVMRVFHWVVRGDTLGSIAARWGTTPDLIIYNNWNYFHDLRLRNITYGLVQPIAALGPSQQIAKSWTNGVPMLSAASGPIQLEPGVRLHIYDVLQVRYHVRRGDTIGSIIDGTSIRESLRRGPEGTDILDGFLVQTTVANLRAENRRWFDDVASVNRTLNLNHELLESQEVGSVHSVGHTCPITGIRSAYFLEAPFGTPIYITIPVRAFMCPYGEIAPDCAYMVLPQRRNIPGERRLPDNAAPLIVPGHRRIPAGYTTSGPNAVAYSHVSYLRGVAGLNVEVTPWVAWDATLQFNTFNPPATNANLIGHALGTTQAFGLAGATPHFIIRNLPGNIRGGIDIPGPVGALLP